MILDSFLRIIQIWTRNSAIHLSMEDGGFPVLRLNFLQTERKFSQRYEEEFSPQVRMFPKQREEF